MLANPQKLSKSRLLSRIPQYWLFQVGGWSALTVFNYVSLTLWYNPGEWYPALHTALQSVIGLFLSHPLRYVARQSWGSPIARRITINVAAVLAASLLWTALRLETFIWLTGEEVDFDDWGGWVFASVIVFAAWSLCYHALRYYREWTEQRELAIRAQNTALKAKTQAQKESIRRLHAESAVRESKLLMLKYQLSPHFFLNALNSVTSLVQKDKKKEAVEMLARIGDFLRSSLYSDGAPEHTLHDEIDILRQYIDIEKVRFGDRLNIEFAVSEDAKAVVIPNLLLQPLIENSIKHAVSRSLSTTTIRLKATLDNSKQRLDIVLSDTGPGADAQMPKTSAESAGIGLKNVEERLRSAYGDDYALAIESSYGKGLTVRLSISSMSRQQESEEIGEDSAVAMRSNAALS